MERLILLLQQSRSHSGRVPDLFVAVLGDRALREGFRLVQGLRARGIAAEFSYGGGSLKSQMRRADKLGVPHVLILGDEELKAGRRPFATCRPRSRWRFPWPTPKRPSWSICAGAHERWILATYLREI